MLNARKIQFFEQKKGIKQSLTIQSNVAIYDTIFQLFPVYQIKSSFLGCKKLNGF